MHITEISEIQNQSELWLPKKKAKLLKDHVIFSHLSVAEVFGAHRVFSYET